MAHTNPGNPVNWPEVVSESLVHDLNQYHRDMLQHIRESSGGSLALEQVRIAQYAAAVSEVDRAVMRLFGIVERTMENALAERPCDELDELKDQLGLS